MIGIVIVSHSHLLAKGLQDMAIQMSKNMVKIEAAGGVDDANIGTNAERIHRAIEAAYSPDGVLILFDLGSALFSTQMAIEMLPAEHHAKVKVSAAHLVEGAIVAAVEASLGHSLEEVNAAAEAVKDMQKIL
ncbi:MAG: PTS-dependent dihydroxyacetone kinase phosphotransferase subunit DhaM [Anaerolineales bacterium]|nr:PTS-dependent dihydroxyacetone kinase phosphotransferase subunit DhaM [Anaerolineales bacterium]